MDFSTLIVFSISLNALLLIFVVLIVKENSNFKKTLNDKVYRIGQLEKENRILQSDEKVDREGLLHLYRFVLFYTEKKRYSSSWRTGDTEHVMEDKGSKAERAETILNNMFLKLKSEN